MKFDIAQVFEQLIGSYLRLPLSQKIALPLLLAAGVGVIVFVSQWASRPSYKVLFSGLDEADAAGVVDYLKDNKVGFQLADGGSTVRITPPEMVSQVKLELAAAGLPAGKSSGFELFNETSLGESMVAELMKKVRATQGELERTIRSLDVVRDVRVHVTMPRRSVFARKDVPPTASVLLRLRGGSRLTPMQVKGIAHLVANSVEGLAPDKVTILDSKSNILNEQSDNPDLQGADLTRLEYQRSIENTYAKRIESMLTEVLGQGKAVARVTADVDFSKYEKEEEAYDPGGTVVRSERVMQEGSSLSASGGVPGVVSNLTNDPGLLAAPDSSKNNNLRSESVKNYEISRAVSKTSSAIGKITKLSVAVLVDGTYVAGATDEEQAYKPLGTDMLKKIENLVKQAVGFDVTRGDIVSVENIRFAPADDTIEQLFESDKWLTLGVGLVPSVLTFVGIILFFLFLVKPLVSFLVAPSEGEIDLSRLLPAGIEELEAELEAEREKAVSIPELTSQSINIEELEELLSENSRLVKENPQQASLLIRYWLNEGRM